MRENCKEEIMLNDYYQNIGKKEYFRRYGAVNGIRRGLFTGSPVHVVPDYEIRKVLWQKEALKKVGKFYRYKNVYPDGLKYGRKTPDNPVWVFWDSGLENAPEIIQRCFESVEKFSGREVILLTTENVRDFVRFPDYITWRAGKKEIPLAHYSDLLRFSLLAHYGGTWMDATVYLTGKIPGPILEGDLFLFRNQLGLLDNPVLYPVWLMHSSPGHEIMREIRNIEFAYWTQEKHPIEYLISNLIIRTVMDHHPDEEKEIPYMTTDYSEYLVRVLPEDFTRQRAEWIKGLTPIHKLTYKLDPAIDREGSIYRSILDRTF
jgi:hypothetical protein